MTSWRTFLLPEYPGGTLAVATFINIKYPISQQVPTDEASDDEPSEVTAVEAKKPNSNDAHLSMLNQINYALWLLVGIAGAFAISRWF